jgi:lysophospholipase L1-like esterase
LNSAVRGYSLLLALVVSAAAQAQPAAGERWVATWGTAQGLAVESIPDWVEPPPPELMPKDAPPPPIPPVPDSFENQTVRMIVRASVGGRALRVVLSNATGTPSVRIGGVHVALHERDSAIAPGSDRAVSFGGNATVAIPPGALAVSDPIDLQVPALSELAVSLYIPDKTGTGTTHSLGLNTTYVTEGDTVGESAPDPVSTNRTYFWLSGVDVLADADTGAILAFGDSITDGYGTTPGAHREWPALLAGRLQASAATTHRAVVNLGLSGNRIRRDLAGTSGLARFDRDVLSRAGVEWILLAEGINDITFSALPRAPDDERASAEEVIDALSLFVDRAHVHGLKVMGATLTPMGGLWLFNPRTEAMRQTVNDWIRTGGKFDAIVDFDIATRDPDKPERLKPAFDSGDHIHPNDAGNAAMADIIDLSVFTH